MRWFETPNYPFVATRKIGYMISGTLLVISIAALLFKGLSYGIDFKGGKELVVEFDTAVSTTAVRDVLTPALGSQPEVKQFGLSRDLLVRTDSELDATALQNTIVSTLTQAFPGNGVVIIKTDDISPRFADDLKWGALNAILFSIVVIFLYILVRFKNWTYSLGTIAAIALVLENVSIDKDGGVSETRDNSNEPNSQYFFNNQPTLTATAQVASVDNCRTLRDACNLQAGVFSYDVGGTAENWVLTSVGQAHQQGEAVKFNITARKAISVTPTP
jgi:hypothetical protein